MTLNDLIEELVDAQKFVGGDAEVYISGDDEEDAPLEDVLATTSATKTNFIVLNRGAR